MDDARLVSRLMAMPIPVAAAKRLFPGTPAGSFFDAAPFDGRGRFLPLRKAFEIARACAVQDAAEGKAAIAAAARSAEVAERRAAVAAPAVEHMAGVVERELAALSASLRAHDASPRAVKTLSLIQGRCARQIGRARSRIEKGGADGRAS